MKGKTNNPFGRPAGVPNRTTSELRTTLQCLLENNIDKIQKDIDSLEPKDRLSILLKIAAMCLPSMQAIKDTRHLLFGKDAEDEQIIE